MNKFWSYVVLTVSAVLTLAMAAICWWLGWLGIKPSVIGFVVVGGAVILTVLECWAYRLARSTKKSNNGWSVFVAHIAAWVMLAFFAFLASNIGWKAAGATLGVMTLWGLSVVLSFITVRAALNRLPATP